MSAPAATMRRVLVIGAGGAGKSTFARQLGTRLGLPVVHLDAVYWQPGWRPTEDGAWAARVADLLAGEAWVMDGNFGGTLEQRLAAADTVVLLDLPRLVCLARVMRRRLRYRGRTRPDMAAGCPERLDAAFLWWVLSYPERKRPRVLARLAALSPATRVVRLRSARAVQAFLDALPG